MHVLWLDMESSRSAAHHGHSRHDDSDYGLTLTRAVKLVVRGGRAVQGEATGMSNLEMERLWLRASLANSRRRYCLVGDSKGKRGQEGGN